MNRLVRHQVAASAGACSGFSRMAGGEKPDLAIRVNLANFVSLCTATQVCRQPGQGATRRVGAEGAAHAEQGLGDDGDGDHLQPVQGAGGQALAEMHEAEGEDHERRRRGQREAIGVVGPRQVNAREGWLGLGESIKSSH